MNGSLYPNFVGSEQVRRYTLTGDRLTLEVDRPPNRAKLVSEQITL